MERVCVVVVTYNGAPWIRRCLDSLRASHEKSQVVVVDNCSTDQTLAILAAEYPEVKLITEKKNNGFGIGNNIGISFAIQSGFEYLFLLNQDAYILPDCMGDLREFMDKYPEYGITSPLHCSPNINTIDQRTFIGYIRNYATEYLCDAALGLVKSHYKIRGINAAAWMVRTEVFRQVGGFDPLFFMYGEDDDLIARFEDHSMSFALIPSARAIHLRETAVAPESTSYWKKIQKRARRSRSTLLTRVKRPGYTSMHRIMQLMAHGIINPATTFVIERDTDEFLGMFVASCQLLFQIPKIKKHSELCNKKGSHFLDI